MKKIGGYLVFFGLFAIVLNFMGMVPKLLFWIYSWGETVAWAIKIGFIAVGAGLYLFGMKQETTVAPSEQPESTNE